VKLSERFDEIERDLPADWETVEFRLTTEQPAELARAAQVLGSMGVGRVGDALAVTVRRAGGASGPEAARRLFRLLDEDRIWCEISTGAVSVRAEPTSDARAPAGAAASWDAAVATLPADWSDLLCRLELESSALVPRAALLCAPVNPSREREGVALTFRAASTAGYGASAGMVRRCLQRLDAEGIMARVSVLRMLADSHPVATQGPVWRIAGRSL
jgi:hypothetical protein